VPTRPSRSAADYIPDRPTLPVLREAVQKCKGCDLYMNATQAVFGEGPRRVPVMLIGEQPGNEEDLEGHPFVGPAGRLLRRALGDAGIDPEGVYITNAVKHFKFEPRGKRRIHQKPTAVEVKACRPWLEAEVALMHPRVIVCLGATAAQTVFGAAHRVTKQRGQFVEHPWAERATSTIHPSAILRAPDDEQRERDYLDFVADLKVVAAAVRSLDAK
jgi:uracil-DNA glycosylase family protein